MEDASGVAPSGKHRHLIGDPRSGAVDQVEHRDLQPLGGLLDADDLLDRPRPPRSRLDGGVVGHHRAGTAVEHTDAGDDPVGGEVRRLAVGHQPVLDEVTSRVEEAGDALAGEEFSLTRRLLVRLG